MSKISPSHNWMVEGQFPFLDRGVDSGASLREALNCTRKLRAILNLDGIPSRLEYPNRALEVEVPENKAAIRDQFREVIRCGGFVDWKKPDGKEAVVNLSWGGKVPDFVWYDLGETNLPREQLEVLHNLAAQVAFPSVLPRPSSVEFVRDIRFGDHAVMKIHNPLVFLPVIDGHVLYAVGNPYGNSEDVYAGGRVINFAELANRLQELKMAV